MSQKKAVAWCVGVMYTSVAMGMAVCAVWGEQSKTLYLVF